MRGLRLSDREKFLEGECQRLREREKSLLLNVEGLEARVRELKQADQMRSYILESLEFIRGAQSADVSEVIHGKLETMSMHFSSILQKLDVEVFSDNESG